MLSYLLIIFVIPGADHVRHHRRERFYLPHELVTYTRVSLIHVICKVTNVKNEVYVVVFCFLLQVREGLYSIKFVNTREQKSQLMHYILSYLNKANKIFTNINISLF